MQSERQKKAQETLNRYKAEIAQAAIDAKKSAAKSKRDAKKPKLNKNTFGDIISLNADYNKGISTGFIYKIEVLGKVYIGKKSYKSKSNWKTYKSSSEKVKRLIKKAITMGVTPIYTAISTHLSAIELAKAETAAIHSIWSSYQSQGRLDDVLNEDDGTGHGKKADWLKLYLFENGR